MSYPEYPHSNFPDKVCDLPNMQDVSATLRPVVEKYNEAWVNNDTDTMTKLKEEYPDLIKSLFNADKFNTLLDEVKTTQKFFKEDVDKMVQTVANKTVGINDKATGESKKTNAYSAEKTDYLSGVSIATNVSIPVSSWDDKLTYTYKNSKILANDRVDV